jgi:hypothetical protein
MWVSTRIGIEPPGQSPWKACDRGGSSDRADPRHAEDRAADPMSPADEAKPAAKAARSAGRVLRWWEEHGGTMFVIAVWMAIITIVITRRSCE